MSRLPTQFIFRSFMEAGEDPDDQQIQTFTEQKSTNATVNEMEQADADNEEIKEKKLKEEKEVIEKQKEEQETKLDGMSDEIGGDAEDNIQNPEDVSDGDDDASEFGDDVEGGAPDEGATPDEGDETPEESQNETGTDDKTDGGDDAANVQMLLRIVRTLNMEYSTPAGIIPNRVLGRPSYEDAADAAILDNGIRPSEGSGEEESSSGEGGMDDSWDDSDTDEMMGDEEGGGGMGGDEDEGAIDMDETSASPTEEEEAADDATGEESEQLEMMFNNWYNQSSTGAYPVNPSLMRDHTYLLVTEGIGSAAIHLTMGTLKFLSSGFVRGLVAEGLTLIGKGLRNSAKIIGNALMVSSKNFILSHARVTWLAKYWNGTIHAVVATVAETDLTNTRVHALHYDVWIESMKTVLVLDAVIRNAKNIVTEEGSEPVTAAMETVVSRLSKLGIRIDSKRQTVDFSDWRDKQESDNVIELGYTPKNIEHCNTYFSEIAPILEREKKGKEGNMVVISEVTKVVAENGKAILTDIKKGKLQADSSQVKKRQAAVYTQTTRLNLLSALCRLEADMLAILTKNCYDVFKVYGSV